MPDEIRTFLEEYPPAVRDVALELREMIRATLPEAGEALDRSGRVVGYAMGAGYTGLICTIIPRQTGVKQGIVDGASLPDPQHLMEGTGKRHKYVALTAIADLQKVGLRPLLTAAVARLKTKGRAARL